MFQVFTKFFVFSLIFLLSAQCSEAAEKYKAGRHFEVLSEPVLTRDNSRVEVVEFFWFGCGHCFTLEALLNDWKKELPSSVDFYRYPVIWNKMVETHAKLFFIAEALNKPEIVNGVFNAIHIRQKMLASDKEIIPFLKTYGVSEDQYKQLGNSFGLKNNIKKADLFSEKYGIKGVPTFIVNGKYAVSGNREIGTKDLLNVVDFLIAKERKK